MATIDYKQKIKDYMNSSEVDTLYKSMLKNLFPELKESEDERIKKNLIKLVKMSSEVGGFALHKWEADEMLAWLERQGKQKPEGKTALEVIKEEKVDNANKVEPKFKVDDFIVNDYCMGKVIELTNDAYLLDTGQGIPFSCEHNAHLWTIQDAKDGDVLASELCDSVILFKGIKDNNIDFYCDYDFSKLDVPGDRFAINNGQNYGSVEEAEDFHPATKEQRDTLMKAMADAGYTFDFVKKELKKIDQKSAEWSEEDKKMFVNIKACLRSAIKDYSTELNWLKFLKDRLTWKPSEEQMKTLNKIIFCTYNANNIEDKKHIESLYNDLKKLKG